MNYFKLYSMLEERTHLKCKFCGVTLPNNDGVVSFYSCSPSQRGISTGSPSGSLYVKSSLKVKSEAEGRIYDHTINAPEEYLTIEYIKCPSCGKTSIKIYRPFSEETFPIYPRAIRENYPEYIPEQIRQDYEEACLIADLSPKASATLARRCLQGMIRSFWGINKRNLVDEIEEVSKISGMPQNQKDALNALRNIGNIGAHPERDINIIVNVEPDEAKTMISLIEFFMHQWFIRRHEDEEMMNNIVGIAQQKKELKHPPQEQN